MSGTPGFVSDPDIRQARLPPAELYGDPSWFDAIRRRVLARSWHLLHSISGEGGGESIVPVRVGEEPCLWTRAGDGVERLLSNVCTHRGALIASEPCSVRTLRCPYHGRRWRLDGRCSGAPGFEDVDGFPAATDHLASGSFERRGPWAFGAVDPAVDIDAWIGPVFDRLDWFGWDQLVHDPTSDRDYTLDVAFALYLDNYLEGFHVPYVHPSLARVLDPGDYRNELLPHGTLQIGLARDPADAFDIPSGPDAGEPIAGFYFWLFPTTMVNVYPWGVSLNLVRPLGPMRTAIEYRMWVCDPERRARGAGSALDEVELEDQAIVRRTQAGVRSILYPGGTYAPEAEVGVHHFHRLLSASLR